MTKKQLSFLLFCLAVFVVAVPNAAAQRTRPTPHDTLPPLMKLLDLDKNGSLSLQEIAVASKVLKKLDANGDGFLTVSEVTRTPPKSNQQLSRYMMKKDKNGDGKLSKAELGDRFAKMFDDFDKNKDGVLTKKEILFAVDKYSSKPIGSRKGE